MWLLTALVLTVLIYTGYSSMSVPLVWVSYFIGI